MQHYKLGIFAEYLAMLLYKFKFYKILHHRYKSRLGEIDVIAKRFNTVVFIEVKARKEGMQEGIVSFNQQQRIRKSAEYFLAKNTKFANCVIRFDLVVVGSGILPVIIKNAF